jgi:plasmid stabilization system protein ParE
LKRSRLLLGQLPRHGGTLWQCSIRSHRHPEELSGSPVVGRPGVRQIVHTPILIYYRVNESPNFVEILHFWHGSRRDPRF